MSHRPRRVPLLGALFAALVFATALPAATDVGGSARPEAATASHTVTLITGDVVRVKTIGDRVAATVERAPGSAGGVQTLTIGDDLYVIPDETRPYLAAGRLDRELLNVTGLIEQGYDDESAGSLPLIAQYGTGVRTAAGRAAPAGAEKRHDLASINGAALTTTTRRKRELFWVTVAPERSAAPSLQARFTGGITKLWLDAKVEVDLADSVPQVGAPQAWADGFDGTGSTVAVLDTGVDATHVDLAGRITATQSFVPGEDAGDRNGHGTHVASTVAGSGAASEGANKGVAPGAALVIGKVLDDSGFGQASWLIDGMEWASERADVVNMSLGDPDYTDGLDPISLALNELTEEKDVLFVVAAGNSYSEFTIGSPGAADAALTVAAVDGLDQRAVFSSMGPRVGDHALKPDLAAPGVEVTAARSQQMPWGEGMYQTMDGTSMATPHVAGAAAILAAKHPSWPARRLKDALMSSSKALEGTTAYEVGAGRLDIPAALGDVHASGSVFFGFHDWPHDGDAPVSRTVTYTNAGDAPVVLTLDDIAAGPGGPTPDLFELSTSTITVAAGGSADVTVTADADDAPAVGRFTGAVVATGASGAVVARTVIGLVKEEERYDLSVKVVDRSGEPASGYVLLHDYRSPWPTFLELDPETGTAATQRLQPGPYNVSTWLDVDGTGGPDSSGVALLAEPHVVVDRDREVVLDARRANRVSVSTPRPSEDRHRRMYFFHDAGIENGYPLASVYFAPPNVDDLFAAPTGTVPGAAFDFAVRWRRSAPLLSLAAHLPAKQQLDPLYQGGSTRLDGKVRLDAVYAGTGTPGEYAGLDARGKAVLITRSDAVPSWDWIAPAQEAGAALLVVVDDRPGRLYEFVSGDVPVLSLTRAQGEPLVQAALAGRLTLRGDATAFPEYMYDLVLADEQGIPDDLSYAPRIGDLAKVDHRFLGGAPGIAFEGRYDCRASYSLPPCMGSYEPVAAQSTRTDYVSTGAGTRWYQDVFHASGWEQRHDQVTYRPGQRTSLDWLAPITRPRLGPGFWGPYRVGDFMAVNVPFASGGDRLTGVMFDAESTVISRLYHEGTLIAEDQPWQAVYVSAPTPEDTEYRFEQDTTRPADPWGTSIRTHTAWTFRSREPEGFEQELLPLLQLDYSVETDLQGSVGRQLGVLGVSAAHEPGVVGGGAVQGVTLELSYDDGATWQTVALRPAPAGGWKASIRYPRQAGGGFVSLRATAWDDAGNRVEQEIVRAYALR